MKHFIKNYVMTFFTCAVVAGCSSGNDTDSSSSETAVAGTTAEQTAAEQAAAAAAAAAAAEEPTTRTLAPLDTGDLFNANFDPDTNIFTLTVLGNGLQLSRFSTADHRAMLAMRDMNGVHNAYFYEGNGTQALAYSGGLAGQVSQSAGYLRTGETEMPLTGSASFAGHYAGFTTTRRVNGDVALNVDFQNARVDGTITNRRFRQRPDNIVDAINPLSDVVLEETLLRTNGTFAGATGGGQIVNGSELWNPATGTYAGLIGGPTGNEAVGSVNLTHNAPSGASIEEIGAFYAR